MLQPMRLHQCRNNAERDLFWIVQAATENDLLWRWSLRDANAALTWLVQHARWIRDLTPGTLRAVAHLAQNHRHDWQRRARAQFCGGVDHDIRPGWVYPPIPKRRVPYDWEDTIIVGQTPDAFDLIPDHSLHAIVTSPPYAQQRTGSYDDDGQDRYGWVSEERYPGWTVNWVSRAMPKLRPGGSLIIVIGEHIRDGAVVEYVEETKTALRNAGFQRPGFGAWFKPNAAPVGHRCRPRSAHEQVLWYAPDPQHVYCDPTDGGRLSARIGLLNGSETFHQRHSRDVRTDIARKPSLAVAPIVNRRGRRNKHPAMHPISLYEYWIPIVCPRGGITCDPFCGSGTTLIAARKTGRRYLGIEAEARYARRAERELAWLTRPPRTIPRRPKVQLPPAHRPELV